MEKVKSIFTQEVRAYIYRVLLAIGALLAAYGFLSSDQLAQIIGLVTVVLNVMPTANTSTKL